MWRGGRRKRAQAELETPVALDAETGSADSSWGVAIGVASAQQMRPYRLDPILQAGPARIVGADVLVETELTARA